MKNLGFLFLFFLLINSTTVHAQSCTYDTYKWNVNLKRAVDIEHVKKLYAEITPQERNAETGCSICREDQVRLTLMNGKSVQLCRRIAAPIEDALNNMIARGETINTIIGYRVGMTRGLPDKDGNRTGFSNHSFGIALDINVDMNGLYGNCVTFGPQCKLRKGGPWQPNVDGGLHEQHPIVRALKDVGLKWGGQIKGSQKDFMHFSPSGY